MRAPRHRAGDGDAGDDAERAPHVLEPDPPAHHHQQQGRRDDVHRRRRERDAPDPEAIEDGVERRVQGHGPSAIAVGVQFVCTA